MTLSYTFKRYECADSKILNITKCCLAKKKRIPVCSELILTSTAGLRATTCVTWSGHQSTPLQLRMEIFTLWGRRTSLSLTKWLKEHAKSGHSSGVGAEVETWRMHRIDRRIAEQNTSSSFFSMRAACILQAITLLFIALALWFQNADTL